MWIKNNVICLDIPRTGTTSLSSIIKGKYLPHFEGSVSKQLRHTRHSRFIPTNISIHNKFIFTVVRSPYTRAVSVWKHAGQLKHRLQKIPLHTVNKFILDNNYYNDFNYFLDICEYLNDTVDYKTETNEWLLEHCSCYIWTQSLPRLDYSIKLENFENDKHNIPLDIPELPHTHKSKNNYKPSSDQLKRIEEIFKEDFDNFAYRRLCNR